jgi:hypothetical protein
LKPFNLKPWQWILVAVGVLALVGVFANYDASDDAAASPEAVRFTHIDEIGPRRPLGIIAVVVPAGAAAVATEAAARKLCEGRTHCQVLGFDSTDPKPSAMPMTDREASALIYSYTLNRSTGLDESVWKCPRFADVQPGKCMAEGEL